jgi:hypothetical protein
MSRKDRRAAKRIDEQAADVAAPLSLDPQTAPAPAAAPVAPMLGHFVRHAYSVDGELRD